MLIFGEALIFRGGVLARMRVLIKNVKKRFRKRQETGDQLSQKISELAKIFVNFAKVGPHLNPGPMGKTVY